MSDDERRVVDYDESFLNYVEAQIKEFQRQDLLNTETDLTYYDVESSLRKYQSVYFSLVAMKAKTKRNVKRKTREYDIWWDDKYVSVRKRENKLDLSAQKWPSFKELESMTRSENKNEYLSRKEEVDDAEDRDYFVGKLLDLWQAHSYILGHLCGLIKTDKATTNMENRMD
jgi:uncharacterized protein YacL (UPF0231 family)